MSAIKNKQGRPPAAKAKPRVAPNGKAAAAARRKGRDVAKTKVSARAAAAVQPRSSAGAKAVPRKPASAPEKPAPRKKAAAGPLAAFEPERPTLTSPKLSGKMRPKKPAVASAGGISSDAVQRRTGKTWDDWFAILDGAGARDLDHKGIVAILAQRHGVGPWWQQMVTVAYEETRGKSERPEAETGYQVSASKTLNVPLSRLFRMWNDSDQRAAWLSDERFQIKKARGGKSIQARWGRGTSRVDVHFQDHGADKTAVSVLHNQIENRDAAEQMKAYWAKKLDALEKALA